MIFATSTVLNPNPAREFNPTFDSKAKLRYQNDGHWHMVVVSWDDGWKKIYVDGGVAFSEQSPTASQLLGTDNPRYCYIGEGSETILTSDVGTQSRDYYMGDLASMHAWSTVFTDAQIEQMWRAQVRQEQRGFKITVTFHANPSHHCLTPRPHPGPGGGTGAFRDGRTRALRNAD